jgi:hypothetical protein
MRHQGRSARRPEGATRFNEEWASSETIEGYLEGLTYPASRQDVLDTAKSNGAPDDVVQTLRQFSDRMFNSAVDISKELGLVE